MSMLAGPRRKQKVINLRAKNNDWSNDTNKFGQRMLEKMGWSSGKGLGAKENGIVEHVVARYKNDEKGLGYEDKNDQWTKHEDDFNALLANLSSADSDEPVLHSGISLEIKSKKSKARIHYHKFTRGKDLSRYSEKDLANIFGKKTLKSLKHEEKQAEDKVDNVEKTEQIFTEKGSMDDYFKNKMASFKLKMKFQDNEIVNRDGDENCGFQGFSSAAQNEETSQGFGFKPYSFYNATDKPQSKIVEDSLGNSVSKKKKKKSKHNGLSQCDKDVEFESNNLVNNEIQSVEAPVLEKSGKKSKKKTVLDQSEADECDKSHKKKLKKQKELCSEKSDELSDIKEEIHVAKKKKKLKNKEL